MISAVYARCKENRQDRDFRFSSRRSQGCKNFDCVYYFSLL